MTGRLQGRVVATTRSGGPDGRLAEALRREGADVRSWPTLSFSGPEDDGPLERALDGLGAYDWLAFTSPRAVASVAARRRWTGGAARVAAVGERTAALLREAGWPVHVVGPGEGAAGLARAMAGTGGVEGRSVLFFAGSMARPVLEGELEAAGARVHRVETYRTEVTPPPTPAVRADLAAGVDAVLFASPSAVAGLDEALHGRLSTELRGVRAVAIGPTTADALAACGLSDPAVARTPSLDALVDACVEALDPNPSTT